MGLAREVVEGIDLRFSATKLLQTSSDGLVIVRDNARLPTGMEPLDQVMGGGFRVGDLVLVGGRPGVGKTILGLQWARAIAMSGATAVVASYEHDEQTLLGRLIALEIGMLELGPVDTESELLVAGLLNGEFSLGTDVGRHPMVRAATARVESYAGDVVLLPAARLRLDLDSLESAFTAITNDRKALIIDYVQKVPIRGGTSSWDSEGARIVSEKMKDLALSTSSVVIAMAAVDEAGLQSRRVRVPHLRSSASLSYEADVVVMMNDKAMCTSRVHMAYDLKNIEIFGRQVVLSIEKNRSGRAGVDLEFEKDFERFRFRPHGQFVAETLIDGIIVDN